MMKPARPGGRKRCEAAFIVSAAGLLIVSAVLVSSWIVPTTLLTAAFSGLGTSTALWLNPLDPLITEVGPLDLWPH